MRTLSLLGLSLLPTLLFGCSGKDDCDTSCTGDADTDTDTDADTDADSDTDADASVTITSPATGSYAYAFDGVTMTWSVEGLALDPNGIGGDNADGVGHVHVYLDNEYLAATAETTYTYEGLSPGKHDLAVRLAENDHTETNLNASSGIGVEVLDPTVAITDPVMDTTLSVSSASLDISLTDFTISDEVGMAAAVGEGHYHIYVDGVYVDYGTVLTDALVPRLSEGAHTITVKLAGSDHSEIGVETSVDVTVADGAQSILIDGSPYVSEYGSASVPLDVDVGNFSLGSGRGYNLYLDDVLVGESETSAVTLRHVASGLHWLEARLHDADGVETGARDYIRLDVADDARDLTITSPTDGETINGDFNLQATSQNFIFDPGAVGGTNTDGTGHFHVYIDGVYWTYGAGSTTVSGVPAGEHEILIELVNNDHSTATPTASDVIHVTVN